MVVARRSARRSSCSSLLSSHLPTDFNGDHLLTVQDIFDFLSAWFASDPLADFNHVNGITIQDVFDYLEAWFEGC